jgi:hypothetical protein
MSDVATLIADMVTAGVDPVLIGRTAALLAKRDDDVTSHTVAPSSAAIRKRRQRARQKGDTQSKETTDGVTCHATPSPLNPPLFLHTSNTPPIIPPSTNSRVSKRAKPKIEFDGTQFSGITIETRTMWRDAYPALDIELEIRQAQAWLYANPRNLKSNYAKFLTNWFKRAQDRAPRVTGQPFVRTLGHLTPQRPSSPQLFDRMDKNKNLNDQKITDEN